MCPAVAASSDCGPRYQEHPFPFWRLEDLDSVGHSELAGAAGQLATGRLSEAFSVGTPGCDISIAVLFQLH
jgi:hypothetical protein